MESVGRSCVGSSPERSRTVQMLLSIKKGAAAGPKAAAATATSGMGKENSENASEGEPMPRPRAPRRALATQDGDCAPLPPARTARQRHAEGASQRLRNPLAEARRLVAESRASPPTKPPAALSAMLAQQAPASASAAASTVSAQSAQAAAAPTPLEQAAPLPPNLLIRRRKRESPEPQDSLLPIDSALRKRVKIVIRPVEELPMHEPSNALLKYEFP